MRVVVDPIASSPRPMYSSLKFAHSRRSQGYVGENEGQKPTAELVSRGAVGATDPVSVHVSVYILSCTCAVCLVVHVHRDERRDQQEVLIY